jgi:uncharacterized membrane protein
MWFIKKKFFTKTEEKHIISAIKEAELASSGEVRVFVESHCKGNIEARTIEIFKKLKMNMTRERNGVLIYVAIKDRRFTIFGDEGIHHKMGFQFWKEEVEMLKSFFVEDKIIEGLNTTILSIGQILKEHFPYHTDDKNELPDSIAYGD